MTGPGCRPPWGVPRTVSDAHEATWLQGPHPRGPPGLTSQPGRDSELIRGHTSQRPPAHILAYSRHTHMDPTMFFLELVHNLLIKRVHWKGQLVPGSASVTTPCHKQEARRPAVLSRVPPTQQPHTRWATRQGYRGVSSRPRGPVGPPQSGCPAASVARLQVAGEPTCLNWGLGFGAGTHSHVPWASAGHRPVPTLGGSSPALAAAGGVGRRERLPRDDRICHVQGRGR